jgi:hypothetical protein
MATTNLISKSLGDILTESGNGTPDHVSPKGSLYTDKDSGYLYQNRDGNVQWEKFNSVAYGEAYFQNNTSATTINTVNVWEPAVYPFTEGDVLGFSADTTTLSLLNGYDGDYEIIGDVTIEYVAGTNNYEVGLSINGNDPQAGTFQGCLIDATYTRQHIGFATIQSLSGGTSLSLDVRNITNNDNVILTHGHIFTRRLQ